jgi:hypothetical protein
MRNIKKLSKETLINSSAGIIMNVARQEWQRDVPYRNLRMEPFELLLNGYGLPCYMAPRNDELIRGSLIYKDYRIQLINQGLL